MRLLVLGLTAVLLSACAPVLVKPTASLPANCFAKHLTDRDTVLVKVGESCRGSKLRLMVGPLYGYLGANGTVVESVHVQNLPALLIELQLPASEVWHVVYADTQ